MAASEEKRMPIRRNRIERGAAAPGRVHIVRPMTLSFGDIMLIAAQEAVTWCYLAGVNEHAVLRIVGSKRWSEAYFPSTIQYLFESEVAS